MFAPADHPMFQLVPPSFEQLIREFYINLGSPAITRSNVCDVYNSLLEKFGEINISMRKMKEWDENYSNAQDAEWGQDELEKLMGSL